MGSESEKRLEGRQAQQHTSCLLILLGRHPHVLGGRLGVAQGTLQRAVSIVRAATGQRVHEPDGLGRSMRAIDRRQENLRPLRD